MALATGQEKPKVPNKEDDKKIVDLVMGEKKAYEESTKSIREEIKEIWNAMNGELSANVYPWENPQFIPKMRTDISFITPFIFSGDPELEVEQVGDEDKPAALVYDKILDYRMKSEPRIFDVALSWVTQAVGMGTSLLKVSWEFKTKKVKGQTYEKPTTDAPKYEVPNILDIYVNPLIAEIKDQKSVIERISMSIEQIKATPHFNKNKTKVKAKKNSNDDNEYNSGSLDDTDLENTDDLDNEFKVVDVYERWTDDRIITIADGQEGMVLRDAPNPYGFIPYVKFVFEQVVIPNRFYGNGTGQNTIGLQEMYYDLFNLVMLNMKIIVNKMWRVDPGSRVNPDDLIARPGGTVRANEDEAAPIEQSDIKDSAFSMLGLISDEAKAASGATDVVQGSPASRTFGQDQLAMDNASNRYELVRRRLKNCLGKVGWMTLKLEVMNLQSPDAPIMKIFLPAEREAIFEFIKEDSQNLAANVKVRGDTIVATNKDILAKQMLDMFNLVGPSLSMQEQRVFARELARLKGITNIDEYIPQMPDQQIVRKEEAEVSGMEANNEATIAGTQQQQMQQGPPQQQTMESQGNELDGNALPEIGGGANIINEQTYGGIEPTY